MERSSSRRDEVILFIRLRSTASEAVFLETKMAKRGFLGDDSEEGAETRVKNFP